MARTPVVRLTRELENLEAVLQAFPEGGGRADLLAAYVESYGPLHQRTLVRRLSELVHSGRIEVTGRGPATAYRIPTRAASEGRPVAVEPEVATPGVTSVGGALSPEGEFADAVSASPDDHVDKHAQPLVLSPTGAEIRALARRPITEKPQVVHYDETLLRDYEPGSSWYLSPEQRGRLWRLGHTPAADRPAGTYAKHIYELLLIDLSWASSRLEGNQYTRIDTKNLLDLNIRAPDKTDLDAVMIINHRRAIDLLVNGADDESIGYNRYTFCNLHSLLSEGLLRSPADEGRLRRSPVGIENSPYVPVNVPQRVEELFDLMLAKVAAIPDAFEQAFFLLVHIPYLQPFEDVNKRTSRLAANLPLFRANVSPLSYLNASERDYIDATLGVYEERRVDLLRDVFLWLYEISCRRYAQARQDVSAPDPMRVLYRTQLSSFVHDVVVGGDSPTPAEAAVWATQHDVPGQHVARFAELAMELLAALHDGALSRYGVRPSQFAAWTDRTRPQR